MPKNNSLSELDGWFYLIIARNGFYIEESIFKIFGTLAASEKNIVTYLQIQLRIKDLFVR